MKRREFIATVVGGAALVAAGGAPAFAKPGATPTQKRRVAQVPDWALRMRPAPSAHALFGEHADGKPLAGDWAIAHIARDAEDGLLIVVASLHSKGFAEVVVFAPGDYPASVSTKRYDLFMNFEGRTHRDTPRISDHLRELLDSLGEVIAANEGGVELAWKLPTLTEARKP